LVQAWGCEHIEKRKPEKYGKISEIFREYDGDKYIHVRRRSWSGKRWRYGWMNLSNLTKVESFSFVPAKGLYLGDGVSHGPYCLTDKVADEKVDTGNEGTITVWRCIDTGKSDVEVHIKVFEGCNDVGKAQQKLLEKLSNGGMPDGDLGDLCVSCFEYTVGEEDYYCIVLTAPKIFEGSRIDCSHPTENSYYLKGEHMFDFGNDFGDDRFWTGIKAPTGEIVILEYFQKDYNQEPKLKAVHERPGTSTLRQALQLLKRKKRWSDEVLFTMDREYGYSFQQILDQLNPRD